MEQVTHGPFTWTKRIANKAESRHHDDAEVWVLTRPDGMTSFCVKNYGGTPGPGFAGWKLVSGGPFDRAGAYSTRDEAIAGVTPWLIDYYKGEAALLRADAERMLSFIDGFIKVVSAGEHLRGGV